MAVKSIKSKVSLIRNPDVVLREEDQDGALLFNPDTNQIRVINPTGLFIWKHCDGKKDLPAHRLIPEKGVRRASQRLKWEVRSRRLSTI